MASTTEDFEARRIVTGTTPIGRSIIVTDGNGATRAVTPAFTVVDLWASDGVPTTVDAADGLESSPRLSPPEGGLLVRVASFPPDSEWQGGAGYDEAFAAIDGTDAADHEGTPGMHATDTVDVVTLIAGELFLVLEEGETKLRPGDSVVQRGTKHAWSNRSDRPATIVATQIAAKR